MEYRVPFINARKHYQRLKPEIDAAIADCLENGDLILRRQLRDFERGLADFVGTEYAVGVNSCYHALHFSLLAGGIGPGDEVITVAHTFVATVSAIVHCGATPILIDVADDYNMDMDCLERAITPRTRAVMPVHLNGRVCEMDRLMAIAERHKLLVIEDAAQALGASFNHTMAGAFGFAGCFSFYPFKALGGLGDGGAVTTNDPAVARMVTLLRFNGEDRATREFHCHGYTALLDNVQAAVLSAKLRRFPDWITHRRAIARRYDEQLRGVSDLVLPIFGEKNQHDSFQNYVIRTRSRDALRGHLAKAGVETLISWEKPMWRHDGLRLDDPGAPKTEAICREVISLPMSAETELEEADYTAACIRGFFSHL